MKICIYTYTSNSIKFINTFLFDTISALLEPYNINWNYIKLYSIRLTVTWKYLNPKHTDPPLYACHTH